MKLALPSRDVRPPPPCFAWSPSPYRGGDDGAAAYHSIQTSPSKIQNPPLARRRRSPARAPSFSGASSLSDKASRYANRPRRRSGVSAMVVCTGESELAFPQEELPRAQRVVQRFDVRGAVAARVPFSPCGRRWQCEALTDEGWASTSKSGGAPVIRPSLTRSPPSPARGEGSAALTLLQPSPEWERADSGGSPSPVRVGRWDRSHLRGARSAGASLPSPCPSPARERERCGGLGADRP